MMTDSVKNLLLQKLDEFVREVEFMSDGEFPMGDATSAHFADAVEVVWNSMGYSAKLEASLSDEQDN